MNAPFGRLHLEGGGDNWCSLPQVRVREDQLGRLVKCDGLESQASRSFAFVSFVIYYKVHHS